MFPYQLFAESNKPMPPTGPKQWRAKLTPHQRRVLEGLPVAAPSEQSVLAAREVAFAVFFRDAPPIAQASDVPWPGELERAVRAYLDRVDLRLGTSASMQAQAGLNASGPPRHAGQRACWAARRRSHAGPGPW